MKSCKILKTNRQPLKLPRGQKDDDFYEKENSKYKDSKNIIVYSHCQFFNDSDIVI